MTSILEWPKSCSASLRSVHARSMSNANNLESARGLLTFVLRECCPEDAYCSLDFDHLNIIRWG